MAKLQQVALVFAGPVSRGTLTQLPGLRDHLRWIKSSSVATASRAVRALRAGIPIGDYTSMDDAGIILISVPDDSAESWAKSLAGCGLKWAGRLVVLYDSVHDRQILRPLEDEGATVATLNYHGRPEQFLVDGVPEAVKTLRILTTERPVVRLSDKTRYFHGLRCAREHFMPLFASVVEHFRAAGMQKAAAEKAAAAAIEESTRSYLRAGHRLLTTPVKP